MIESKDAAGVAEVLANNLLGVAKNPANFRRLPDEFWGYFARGHDSRGSFGVFVAYSEDKSDVDELIKTYERWVAEKGPRDTG